MTAERRYNQVYSAWQDGKCICWYRTYERDGQLFYVEVPGNAKRPVNWADFDGKLLPKAQLYTPLLPSYTLAHTPNPDLCYVKRSPVERYSPNSGRVEFRQPMAQEIAACEVLAKHPHPNILRYHGVVPDQDQQYVAALCFDKCGADLKKAIRDGDGAHEQPRGFTKQEKRKIMDDIKKALTHLHDLGYVHNDVNPNNILLPLVDGDFKAVLADFDSCVPVNTPAMHKRGTEGYFEWTETSTPENDWYGWTKTAEFLGLSQDYAPLI